MTYYDQIYDIAVDNYYLISTQEASNAGIPPVELAKLAQRGKLENISRGLYRLTRRVPDENDAYALAVARVGEDAYLYGESVIAMLRLAPTNPSYIFVAMPKRTRKKLPDTIRIKKPMKNECITCYEGVPSQRVSYAIRCSKETMMSDRLQDAARKAYEEGYLLRNEYIDLKEEMGWA